MPMRGVVLVVASACAACGRIDFDPLVADGAGGDGSGIDADPSSYVLGAWQLEPDTSTNTFVELEVDWANQLAYMGTRQPGRCFEVVDFAVDPPVFVTRYGPPMTGGDRCLGLVLDVATNRLLVGSEAGNVVELWDLGADPRAGAYTRLASVPVVRPRRITLDPDSPGVHHVARGSNQPGFEMLQVSSGPPYAMSTKTFNTSPCPDSHNDIVAIDTDLVLSACSTDLSPVEVVDEATTTVYATIPANASGTTGFWSAARTPDGSFAVVLGWVSIAVRTNAAPRYVEVARWDNADVYRNVAIRASVSGPHEAWTILGDGSLEVLSLEDGVPRVIRQAPLGVTGEGYGISLEPDGTRVLAITNDGWFVLVDGTRLPVTDFTWPPL